MRCAARRARSTSGSTPRARTRAKWRAPRACARLLEGSEIRQSHIACRRVQDAYSLRCAPQVHGAVRDALAEARRVFAIELNSATDNPLVFDDEILSGGNFHGEPLAFQLDFLAVALCRAGGHLGTPRRPPGESRAERRTAAVPGRHIRGWNRD